MGQNSGQRAAKTLSGTFGTRPLAVLLTSACERKASGTFIFGGARTERYLTMKAGRIAVVRTPEPAYLGGVLYETGVIDGGVLNETLLLVAKEKRLHGEILLERRLVTKEQLETALVEQTYRKVHHLFALPEETTWAFRDDLCELTGARDEGRPHVDGFAAVWRGIRDQIPSPHVSRTLAKLEGSLHVRDLAATQRFGFGPEERALCERLAAVPATLVNIARSSNLTADRTQHVLYLLAITRAIVKGNAQPAGPVHLDARAVRERARTIADEDPFTRLGIPQNASVEAARAAYFRLARMWHPDRLPASLSNVRSECEHVFMNLADAHRILTDRGARSTAASTLAASARSGGGAGRSGADPTNATPIPTMREVERLLAKEDFRQAEDVAKKLVNAGATGPAARAAIAWCSCRGGAGERDSIDQALAAIEKVLTGDPDCTRALFYRGRLLKQVGRVDQAVKDFRRAARLDPQYIDAVREVRLIEMRSVTGGSGSSSNIVAQRPPAGGAAAGTSPSSASDESPESVRSGLRRLIARVAGS